MKSTFGQSVTLSIFGESHGTRIGAVLSGLAPGIKADTEYIKSRLELRRAFGKLSTARHETDAFEIQSGVTNGFTTGTPICITIANRDTESADYEKMRGVARPSHADYTAFCKYHGFEDYRGGGHFSGRLTAPLVAAGAIAQLALKGKGITVGTHIVCCAGISDREFCNIQSDIEALEYKPFAVLDDERGRQMAAAIEAAASDGDSVGGVLETAVYGVPAGVGEPFFDSLESVIAHILFSIPAVKGVEFGAGFGIADMRGSTANDSLRTENGRIVTSTNRSGGINGGISNGMPIIIRCAIKPTPSIAKAQETVNFLSGEDTVIEIRGRHDPAIVHRARAAVDAAVATALCDMLAQRYGTDWLRS